jgi:hypothetical protein
MYVEVKRIGSYRVVFGFEVVFCVRAVYDDVFGN